MTKFKRLWPGPGMRRAAAERTRTRRVIAVMVVTFVLLSAGVCAAVLLGWKGPQPEDTHPHRPAAHGGTVVGVGDGDEHYHAEAVLEQRGLLSLYTLGDDAEKMHGVESQLLNATLRPEGSADPTSVVLMPVPQEGDAEGTTSRFVGKLPRDLWGKTLTVTFPDVAIDGKRFRLEFAAARHHAHDPPAQPGEEESLYLTSGGKYTEADIQTNGTLTAGQKFQGFQLAHDLNPRSGDTICPVTRTKANPRCTWVVSGRTYQFCCPPCVDEFVKTAKERPARVQEPGAYVKK